MAKQMFFEKMIAIFLCNETGDKSTRLKKEA
jgi:hypothetical protein